MNACFYSDALWLHLGQEISTLVVSDQERVIVARMRQLKDEQKNEISKERSYNHMTVKVNVSKKTSVTWTTFAVKSEFTPQLNPRLFSKQRCCQRVGLMGFSLPGISELSQSYSNQCVCGGGAVYANQITACPPEFDNLTTSLVNEY